MQAAFLTGIRVYSRKDPRIEGWSFQLRSLRPCCFDSLPLLQLDSVIDFGVYHRVWGFWGLGFRV